MVPLGHAWAARAEAPTRTIFLRGMQSYDEMTVFLGSASATALEGLIMSLKSALIMSPMLRFFRVKLFFVCAGP